MTGLGPLLGGVVALLASGDVPLPHLGGAPGLQGDAPLSGGCVPLVGPALRIEDKTTPTSRPLMKL